MAANVPSKALPATGQVANADGWPPGFGPAEEAEASLFADINITPLVDVVLVLLILFMVSSSAVLDAAREGRLEVSLPQAGEALAPSAQTAVLVVGMGAHGELYLRGERVAEAAIDEALAAVHKEGSATTVVIDADGQLSHANVVHMLDRVRRAGFATVGIGAEQMP